MTTEKIFHGIFLKVHLCGQNESKIIKKVNNKKKKIQTLKKNLK
jgi:hypothetical protein